MGTVQADRHLLFIHCYCGLVSLGFCLLLAYLRDKISRISPRGRGRGGASEAMATEKVMHANSLACRDYHTGEDFDSWVPLFERAVEVAHQIDKGDRRDALCKKWLPLKLDDHSRTSLNSIDERKTWDETKTELSTRFADPQDRYNWLAGRDRIKWDGKESFHTLAARIKKKVDRHGFGGDKDQEYFFRFRDALREYPEYQKSIDVGCGDKWDLEEAKRIAGRLRLADGNAAAAGVSTDKSVSFVGAAMSDDRLKSLELTLQGIAVRMENLEEESKKSRTERSRNDSPVRERYDRSQSRNRDRDHDRDRRDSRDRDRRDSRDSYRREDSRERRYDRRDSRDSRDSRSRDSSYGRYDRRGSDSRRGSADRRDYGRRGDYDSRSYDRRSPSRPRDYSQERSSRERYNRDSYRRDGDRSPYRGGSRDNSRDRRDGGGSRGGGYRRGDFPRENTQNAVALRSGDSGSTLGSLDFEAHMDLLAAALQKRQLRDEQPEN